MAQNLIRWRRSDYQKLSWAVRKFNEKIKEFEVLGDVLPELQDYKELKENIYSRSELNRVINSLKRIENKNAFDIVKLESEQRLIKWEAKEIKKAKARAIASIDKEIFSIKEKDKVGMGNERLRELEGTKRSLENIETKKGYEFERVKKRAMELGKKDKSLKTDSLFRENFLKALEGTKDFENYKVLEDKLKSIKNPTKFYEFIKQSDIFMDLFMWYHDKSGTIVYGAFSTNEEAFNRGLEELGLEVNE